MEGAKVGSTAQLEKHESAVVQIVAKESSQNRTSTKANGKAADASKTTQDKVPDTLQQALRKLVLVVVVVVVVLAVWWFVGLVVWWFVGLVVCWFVVRLCFRL